MSKYVGPVELAGTLVFLIETVNGSSVPTDADAAPTYDIYDADPTDSKLVTSGTSTTLSSVTGAYYVSETITTAKGFAAGGSYVVVGSWAISSSSRQQSYRFTVV